ncbi:hypothetical protein [Shimazuella kribbensis]|uniref:hypothetical protein n=1 Tax=Shimazuella kribbensis TaxID=139808 RepID=UPI000420D1C3|nr:hypothetical protein [Shimazuella kribbensis]
MNGKDQEFDTVVLGFDENSKETVEALQEQGKRVLYIPIDPQTMITMMSQKQVHSTATDDTITHLQVQQHQMQTTFQNATTYLVQPIVQLVKPDEVHERLEENRVEELEESVELSLHSTNDEENDTEVVLSDEIETQEVAFTFTDVNEVVEQSHSAQEFTDLDPLQIQTSSENEHSHEIDGEPEELEEEMVENEASEELEEVIIEDEDAEETEEAIMEDGVSEKLEEAIFEDEDAEEIEEAIMENEDAEETEEAIMENEDAEETEEAIMEDGASEETEEAIMEDGASEELEEAIMENEETEENEQDFTFPMITPLTKESSLIDNRMLGIRGSKYRGLQRNDKNGLSGSILSSYHLFNPIRIEGEEENLLHDTIEQTEQVEEERLEEQLAEVVDELEEEPKEHTVQIPDFLNDKNNFIFHGPPLPDTIESSLDENIKKQELEEALTMPDFSNQEAFAEEKTESDDSQGSSFVQHNKLPEMEELLLQSHLEDEHVLEEEMIESPNSAEQDQERQEDPVPTAEENETTEQVEKSDSPTLVLDRDIRLRKKFSFHQLHQESKVAPSIEPVKREKSVTNQVEEQTKKPEVFPLEPFSSRRRNKKSRLFSSLEATIPNPIVQPSNTNKTDKSFSSLIQESIIHHDSEQTPTKTAESESLEDVDKEYQEEQHDHIETSSDNLKIDNIEFEEPYGYNSFEDFFPSFSNSNDRKRQEMDKIEKRKIALRGLHNLINNLG